MQKVDVESQRLRGLSFFFLGFRFMKVRAFSGLETGLEVENERPGKIWD